MKAERNCLRNMSSSSDDEDWLGRQGKHGAAQRKGSSAAQVGEKQLIRNTNHHHHNKSQSISGTIPSTPPNGGMQGMDHRGSNGLYDGNPRMSLDGGDPTRMTGNRLPGSAISARGSRNNNNGM